MQKECKSSLLAGTVLAGNSWHISWQNLNVLADGTLVKYCWEEPQNEREIESDKNERRVDDDGNASENE